MESRSREWSIELEALKKSVLTVWTFFLSFWNFTTKLANSSKLVTVKLCYSYTKWDRIEAFTGLVFAQCQDHNRQILAVFGDGWFEPLLSTFCNVNKFWLIECHLLSLSTSLQLLVIQKAPLTLSTPSIVWETVVRSMMRECVASQLLSEFVTS